VRYPFFDRRLVEFCVAVPVGQKLRRGWTRSILRRALEGILPPEIQWRPGKSDLSPNFHRNLLSLGGARFEELLVDDSEPTVDRFLDRAELRRVLARYRQRPTNDDGMTLFMAASLAAWLRAGRFVQHSPPVVPCDQRRAASTERSPTAAIGRNL
jgi:asparagine synthase (glutamine-hydrolysing)